MELSGGPSGGGMSRSRGMYGPEDDVYVAAKMTCLCVRPVQNYMWLQLHSKNLDMVIDVQCSSIAQSRSLASVHVRLQCSAI